MTRDEWLDIMAWIAPRWTQVAAWSDAEWEAMYEDLKPWAAADVHAMLHRLWNRGREYPPRAGTIIAMLREFQVRPVSHDKQLPPSSEPVSFGDWMAANGYDSVQELLDVMRRGGTP